MYNKLFTKILDSSIWLEPTTTRIVWVTFIAAMDEEGVVRLSAVGNVAARARITEAEAGEAIACLESPDTRSPGQRHEGRRIERIPGVGWLVLNAKEYRDLIKAEAIRAQTRARVEKHRARAETARVTRVTKRNASVTLCNEKVTPSEAVSEADQKERASLSSSPAAREGCDFSSFWNLYPRKIGKGDAAKVWSKIGSGDKTIIIAAVVAQKSDGCQLDLATRGSKYIPHPSTWLNQRRWEDEAETQAAGKEPTYVPRKTPPPIPEGY